ncbi:MAG: MATE family efflux transporter [Tissierellia bacterium]|nr:MATE family efflux transporter [Tissierellia bacterium]
MGAVEVRNRISNFITSFSSKGRMALDLVEPGDYIEQGMSKDLPPGVDTGLLYRDVVRIAWPSLVELTLTQLASMVDLMMVGSLGPWAITSVGLTMQPKFLLMLMFLAMNVGATALVARYRGQGDQEKANMILNQAILLTFILSISASILGFIFSKPMIAFMGASDARTLAGGTVYLKIQMVGLVLVALTSTITAALRGIGNSKTAMRYNLIGNGINVIFNYLLIHGHFGFPRMEVAGASIATVIGQGVSFVLALMVISRDDQYLHISLGRGFKPSWEYLRRIFNIGLPAMVEQLVMRMGMIIYSKLVASLGTMAFATHQIGMNIQALSFMSGQAFAISATSLVGQSLGKKRADMAEAYSRRTRRIGMMVAIALGLIFFFFAVPIMKLYTDDPLVISEGVKIFRLIAIIQPFQSSQFILSGALRGAGDTRTTAVIMLITVLILRPGLAKISISMLDWGLMGAWIALAVDQLMRSLLVVIRYNSGKWKDIEV